MARVINNIAERKSEISEAIIDAAERLMGTYGYQKMTMTDLAAEAGIGVGTTYLHFASKADVAVAVVARWHGRFLTELTELASGEGSPKEILNELLWLRLRIPYNYVLSKLEKMSWQQFQRHGSEFFDDVRRSDPAGFEESKKSEAAIVATVISRGVSLGDFLPVDANLTAKTMLDATHGCLPKGLEHHDFLDSGVFEERAKRVIQLLVNAISVERHFD